MRSGRAQALSNCSVKIPYLALIEIAGFAALRRALGARRADLLMLDVAERIAALRPHCNVAPVGRNLVEMRGFVDEPQGIGEIRGELHAGFASPLSIDGKLYHLDLSVGAAAIAGEDDVAATERAEAALATARSDEVPAVLSSAPSPSDDRQVGRELRAAIARDELFLQYQPKLHLRRQEVTSVEALIRWQHPQRGLIMPNDFIPAAERTGDIADVTLWTIARVIADQGALARHGHELCVFINMAGALLSDAAFVERVIGLIAGSGARIGVEITETSVIGDPKGAIDHLKRLSDIGVVVTIDDYGAGLSSLAYLKQLPASELKIDKLFVTQLSSSHRDPLIVRSTIDLAHALDMEVVAEGVETTASLALLTVMGCDMVQGFLISRPLALEQLLTYLREERYKPVLDAPRPGFGPLMARRNQA